MNQSINLSMVSDVEIGSLLSGGLDSSLISSLASKKIDKKLKTFTISFSKDDLNHQGNTDDSYYADYMVNKFDFDHTKIEINPDIINLLPKIIYHLEEPLSDPSAISTYLISKVAKENNVNVLLSGMGADEVFSGYRYHLAYIYINYFNMFPNFFKSNLKKIFNHIPQSNKNINFKYIRWVKDFLKITDVNKVERYISSSNSGFSSTLFKNIFISDIEYENTNHYKRVKNRIDEVDDDLLNLCFLDTSIYLPDHNLTYFDKSTMANGVEGRPPLIDHEIIEFLFTLPNRFKVNIFNQKYILKKVSEKYLPKKVIYRSKAPFSAPLRGWIKNELNEIINDNLSEINLKKRNIFNYKIVQKLIDENNKGYVDNSQILYRLLTTEIWFQQFFD